MRSLRISERDASVASRQVGWRKIELRGVDTAAAVPSPRRSKRRCQDRGGIAGTGEQAIDRIERSMALANLPQHPERVPINMLIRIAGTPLAGAAPIEPVDFVRTIALARMMMPKSYVRLSAGRAAILSPRGKYTPGIGTV
jgi:hypothetical protein